MLWIRTGFSTDPDPAFYLNADPDTGSQSNVDPIPDPGQTLKSQKFTFHMKNKFTVLTGTVNGKKTYLRRYKSLFGRRETRFVRYF